MAQRRRIRVRAIVCGRTKLAEQDQILTLLAEDGQQMRAVAKGARKPGSRLAARTDLCCECDLLLSLGPGLAVVGEAELIRAYGAGADLSRLSCASAMAEIARMTSFEDNPDPFLFPLLARALASVGEARGEAHLSLALAAYALKVCSHEGWRPRTRRCVLCGEPHSGAFSAQAGGALCASCAKDVAGVEVTGTDAIEWLEALVTSTFDTLMALDADAAFSAYLAELAVGWARTHLECRLRACEFYLGL